MQALKALVIFLGLLIAIGITILGWGLYKKASDPDFKFIDFGVSPETTETTEPSKPLPHSNKQPLAIFGQTQVAIPSDCQVVEMQTEGPLLYIRLGPALSPCEQIIVIDGITGRSLGNIDLRP